jgi:hypothetical protein
MIRDDACTVVVDKASGSAAFDAALAWAFATPTAGPSEDFAAS